MHSITYNTMTYVVHSGLESNRNELFITTETTVENFREHQQNNDVCLKIFNWVLKHWNYELSYSQVANGINLFLIARDLDRIAEKKRNQPLQEEPVCKKN